MAISSRIKALHASLPQAVTLVAVSKFHPVEALKEAYEAGQRIFGESRVQELVAKHEALPKDIEWQMIGHLHDMLLTFVMRAVATVLCLDALTKSESRYLILVHATAWCPSRV